jgi:hypothetical protein
MAYPTVSAPYGFKPINRVDGNVYAGATRQYEIDPAANLFNGQLVQIVSGKVLPYGPSPIPGTVVRPVGVFVGAQYTNSMGQTIQGQYYPAGAANGIAYIVVDPQAAYQVVVLSSGGAGTVVSDVTTSASIGKNMDVWDAAVGNTTSGDSSSGVHAGSESTSPDLPVKVIDVVPATKTATGYPELIVKINVTQFDNATGV